MFSSTLRLITGYIQTISPMQDCFSSLVSLTTVNGPVNFIVSSSTIIIDSTPLTPGMLIGAFYDYQAPITLQYPPTYQAVIVTPLASSEQVMINYFDLSLVATDQSLSLNLDPATQIFTCNGQRFICNPGAHVLLVYYSRTTRSLPPQTTPHKIIVMK